MRTSCYFSEDHLSIRNFLIVLTTVTAVLLCTVCISTAVTARHTQAAQRDTQTSYESVYIDGGDSLWSIAQKYRGTTDTEHFVTQLKTLNGLSSDRIQAGSYLLVPVEKVL